MKIPSNGEVCQMHYSYRLGICAVGFILKILSHNYTFTFYPFRTFASKPMLAAIPKLLGVQHFLNNKCSLVDPR